MRSNRQRATAVVVDGIVHAIGGTKQAPALRVIGEPWGALGEYPLHLGRRTRAQRKAAKAQRLREQANPLIRFACEALWRDAPRTRAVVTCMTCHVVVARLGR